MQTNLRCAKSFKTFVLCTPPLVTLVYSGQNFLILNALAETCAQKVHLDITCRPDGHRLGSEPMI